MTFTKSALLCLPYLYNEFGEGFFYARDVPEPTVKSKIPFLKRDGYLIVVGSKSYKRGRSVNQYKIPQRYIERMKKDGDLYGIF